MRLRRDSGRTGDFMRRDDAVRRRRDDVQDRAPDLGIEHGRRKPVLQPDAGQPTAAGPDLRGFPHAYTDAFGRYCDPDNGFICDAHEYFGSDEYTDAVARNLHADEHRDAYADTGAAYVYAHSADIYRGLADLNIYPIVNPNPADAHPDADTYPADGYVYAYFRAAHYYGNLIASSTE
jgi:hypothetical protein